MPTVSANRHLPSIRHVVANEHRSRPVGSLIRRRHVDPTCRRPCRTRRGVRRHRDQPDLHRADGVQPQRSPPRAAQRPQRLRHRLADLLVDHGHRHAHLREPRDARRQRRRGRHHGPDHPAAPLGIRDASPHRVDPGRARRLRRLLVLRRQHDHACDLGALGDRRHRDRRPGLREMDRADHRRHHRRAVLRATARHRHRRARVRPGDGRVVPRDRRMRSHRYRRAPGDPEGALPDLRTDVHRGAFRDRLLRADRGRARGHRRGGALRRHGPFRPKGDHPGLVVLGAARACPQLPRPGGAADRRSGHHARTLLSVDPRLGTLADGAVGHRRNGYRVAGRHHRGVLGGGTSRPHRLPPAATGDPHVCGDRGPDLRAVDQRSAHGRGDHPCPRLPKLRTPRVRLRNGGDRDDHDHPAAVPVLRADTDGRPRCGW